MVADAGGRINAENSLDREGVISVDPKGHHGRAIGALRGIGMGEHLQVRLHCLQQK